MIHIYLKREKKKIIVNIGLETPIKAINPYEHRTTSYLAISHVFSRAVLGN